MIKIQNNNKKKKPAIDYIYTLADLEKKRREIKSWQGRKKQKQSIGMAAKTDFQRLI